MNKKFSRREAIQLSGTVVAAPLASTTISSAEPVEKPEYEGRAYNPRTGRIHGDVCAEFSIKSNALSGKITFPRKVIPEFMTTTRDFEATLVNDQPDQEGHEVRSYQAEDKVEIPEETKEKVYQSNIRVVETEDNITGRLATVKGDKVAFIVVNDESELSIPDIDEELNKLGGGSK